MGILYFQPLFSLRLDRAEPHWCLKQFSLGWEKPAFAGDAILRNSGVPRKVGFDGCPLFPFFESLNEAPEAVLE